MDKTILKDQHLAFIDEVAKLIDSAKTEVTDNLTKTFDLDAILENPQYGKELMANVMTDLTDYLTKASEVGQKFGNQKAELFDGNS